MNWLWYKMSVRINQIRLNIIWKIRHPVTRKFYYGPSLIKSYLRNPKGLYLKYQDMFRYYGDEYNKGGK